jgi:uncharacterized protein YbbC (DUF1343 family)
MVKVSKILALGVILLLVSCHSQPGITQITGSNNLQLIDSDKIIPGAERTDKYFPLLSGKSIGLVCNHTSMIRNVHLVDSLINSGFRVTAIFSPEHGFRGESEAGAEIPDNKDTKTGVKIISLYGEKKKPLPADLKGIDILLFDIQDAGVRCYTYISTLSLIMEAAAEQGIPLVVTDRPNPNGFYVDGPILDTAFRSFVGMHPVPLVYGMTIGEYAMMVNGEGWSGDQPCDLTVIPMKGYTHSMLVRLNIKPSPNLPSWESIYLYPSLCLFEGTIISVGRGTDKPFQVIGHPGYLFGSYAYTPRSITGVSEHPPYEGQACYGIDLSSFAVNFAENEHHFSLVWLIGMHDFFINDTSFFKPYFNKLAGNGQLMQDLLDGKSEQEIRKSWESDLAKFRKVREKYLLYPE